MRSVVFVFKKLFSTAVNTEAFSRLISFLERVNRAQSVFPPVLRYHRVDYPTAKLHLDPTLISATPEVFDRQMAYLATHYHAVSAPELLDAFQAGRRLPPRSVMVTIDDAYQDFAQYAWPILKSRGLPAALFVPTAFPDHPEREFWWDKLYRALTAPTSRGSLDALGTNLPLETRTQRKRSFKTLKHHLARLTQVEAMHWVNRICLQLDALPYRNSVLSWQELRQLKREGVAMGAHTRTHPLLTHLAREQLQAEILGSQSDLEKKLGDCSPIFAYPGVPPGPLGTHMLQTAGFHLAFTSRTLRAAEHDPFDIGRIDVGRKATLPVLRMHLFPGWKYIHFPALAPLEIA